MKKFKPEELQLKLLPLVGLEFQGKWVLKFGMTRDEVRGFFKTYFGEETEDVKHSGFSSGNCWESIHAFKSSVRCNFRDLTDKLDSVELQNDLIKVKVLERQIFTMSMMKIERWLKEIDTQSYGEDDSLTSSKYGFSVWRRDSARFLVKPEVLLVFEENYA
jgi:hypothetical protein